jgi:hypothetical protein
MSRKLVINDQNGHREIEYSSLSIRQINQRIRAYESKYGLSFPRYYKTFSCADATPDEMTDVIDWELLVEEKALRTKTVNGERVN